MSREDYKSETIDYEAIGLSSGSVKAIGSDSGTARASHPRCAVVNNAANSACPTLPDSPLLTPTPYMKGDLY